MADFVVRIEGVKLSKSATDSINREIQSAILREIARYDPGEDLSVRIPRKEWLGIWLRTKRFETPNVNLQVNEIQR